MERRRGSGGKVKPVVASMTQPQVEPFGEDRTNWRDLVTVGFWNGERGRNRTCNLLIKSEACSNPEISLCITL